MNVIVCGAVPPSGEMLKPAVTPPPPPEGVPAMTPVRTGKSDAAETSRGDPRKFDRIGVSRANLQVIATWAGEPSVVPLG